jgi:hypothetical protein
VDYPLGVIAGSRALLHVPVRLLAPPHDGKVSVASTALPGMADHLVLPLTHWMLPIHPRVHAQVAHFIAEGAFQR